MRQTDRRHSRRFADCVFSPCPARATPAAAPAPGRGTTTVRAEPVEACDV